VLVGPALVQDSWLVGEAAADAANGMAATGMALIAIAAAAVPNSGVRRVMLILMANSFDRSVSSPSRVGARPSDVVTAGHPMMLLLAAIYARRTASASVVLQLAGMQHVRLTAVALVGSREDSDPRFDEA
jgi:hypothetical protein